MTEQSIHEAKAVFSDPDAGVDAETRASPQEGAHGRPGRPRDLLNAATLELGNVRPMIPLQVDDPAHAKYRKLLDPLFAPKRMDAHEGDLADRANHFIDRFVDRGECNFTEEFAELFPSARVPRSDGTAVGRARHVHPAP